MPCLSSTLETDLLMHWKTFSFRAGSAPATCLDLTSRLSSSASSPTTFWLRMHQDGGGWSRSWIHVLSGTHGQTSPARRTSPPSQRTSSSGRNPTSSLSSSSQSSSSSPSNRTSYLDSTVRLASSSRASDTTFLRICSKTTFALYGI